uniref:Uncharacterized protein n=1 Tax=Paramormyrops kingsleyae TaxID=1676925 RepID=A0A3B3SMK1_9TELE
IAPPAINFTREMKYGLINAHTPVRPPPTVYSHHKHDTDHRSRPTCVPTWRAMANKSAEMSFTFKLFFPQTKI